MPLGNPHREHPAGADASQAPACVDEGSPEAMAEDGENRPPEPIEADGESRPRARREKMGLKRFLADYLLPTLAGLVLAVLVFSAGFYVAKQGWLDEIVYANNSASTLTVRDLANRLDEVAGILDDSAIYDFDIDAVTASTLTELLASSGDDYARYYTQSEYEKTTEVSSGAYVGLGVMLADIDGYTMVYSVYDDTPASQGGLKAGDIIVGIDGDMHVWTLEESVAALNRSDGDTVELSLFRPSEDSLQKIVAAASAETNGESSAEDSDAADTAGTVPDEGAGQADMSAYEGESFTVQMTYAQVTIPNVTYALEDGNVGYITVAKFNGLTADAVADAISDLSGQGATSLVVDLREDPGGLADQAVECASLFLDSGSTVMQVEYRHSTDVTKTNRDKVTDLPLVVLVNKDSASASEIFAVAIQGNGRGTIVGSQTYGKGIMQNTSKLSFGGAIKYTFATYLGPNGEQINGVGVTPDVVVADASSDSGDTDDGSGTDAASAASEDPQLDAALAVAREQSADA